MGTAGIELIKPTARAVKYGTAYQLARLRASYGRCPRNTEGRLAFIVGCGRSGTTILGRMISLHPEVTYLFEPYHLWAAIDPVCDVLNLYTRNKSHFILREGDLHTTSARRFYRTILTKIKLGACLVEKTPLNAARIGYLDALAPGANYIHIVRDGYDVAQSIRRLASGNRYRIAGKPNLNQWWGCRDYKWKALVRDAKAEGYYPGEVDEADTSHFVRGIYEWLVTLREIDRYRTHLGERLLEIRFPDLVEDTVRILEAVCDLLRISKNTRWLSRATKLIRCDGGRNMEHPVVDLPPGMAVAFNRYQEYFGYTTKARIAPLGGRER